MAGPALLQPNTGEIGNVANDEERERALLTGARPATAQETETAKQAEVNRNSFSPGETFLAANHASIRGATEAFGIPLDTVATSVADLFGEGDSTRKYLKHLDEAHPLTTGWMGMMGNVRGALGAAELVGAPGAIGEAAAPRTFESVAARMATGGVENVIQATTHDVNEASLGDAKLNAEKLTAQMPKHFLLGALLTGGFEGLGAGVEGGVSALRARGAPVLEREASRALGHEVGAAGEDAIAQGEKIRDLTRLHLGQEVPGSNGAIVSALEAEQGVLRKGAAERHAGALDALAGQQQAEAAGLTARHEAARKATAAEGARGVQTAEAQGAETALDIAAREGAKVEEAELAAGERLRPLREEAGATRKAEFHAAANDTGTALQDVMAEGGRAVDAAIESATQDVKRVASHYDALRQTLEQERAHALANVHYLGHEKDALAAELGTALREMREGPNARAPSGKLTPEQFDEMLDTYLGITGHEKDPSTRWAAEQHLREVYKDEIGSAAEASGEGAVQKVERLKAMAKDLDGAHREATKHLSSLDSASKKLENEAAQRVGQAQRQADSRVAEVGAAADKKVAAHQETVSREYAQAKAAADTANAKLVAEEARLAKQVEKSRVRGNERATGALDAAHERVNAAVAEAAKASDAFEKVATKERESLGKQHTKATKAMGEAPQETEIDPMLEKARARGNAGDQPLVSPTAALGAGLSILHGNPVASALALASSFIAGRVRGQGNILRARALHGIASQLTRMDDAIKNGVAGILGKVTGRTAMSIERAIEKSRDKQKSVTFEEASKHVLEAGANPLILEMRVKQAMGPIAESAPMTYTEAMNVAIRGQRVLERLLPRAQSDPYSLTPHLENGDVPDSQKFEFMRVARTIDDPLTIFGDIKDGSIDQAQVDALREVYPGIYDQIAAEVHHQTTSLTEPVDYMRSIHLGTLLDQKTDEVLDPEFQVTQAAMFKQRSEANQGPAGSKSKSGESAANKSLMSQSESVEKGQP